MQRGEATARTALSPALPHSLPHTSTHGLSCMPPSPGSATVTPQDSGSQTARTKLHSRNAAPTLCASQRALWCALMVGSGVPSPCFLLSWLNLCTEAARRISAARCRDNSVMAKVRRGYGPCHVRLWHCDTLDRTRARLKETCTTQRRCHAHRP